MDTIFILGRSATSFNRIRDNFEIVAMNCQAKWAEVVDGHKYADGRLHIPHDEQQRRKKKFFVETLSQSHKT